MPLGNTDNAGADKQENFSLLFVAEVGSFARAVMIWKFILFWSRLSSRAATQTDGAGLLVSGRGGLCDFCLLPCCRLSGRLHEYYRGMHMEQMPLPIWDSSCVVELASYIAGDGINLYVGLTSRLPRRLSAHMRYVQQYQYDRRVNIHM